MTRPWIVLAALVLVAFFGYATFRWVSQRREERIVSNATVAKLESHGAFVFRSADFPFQLDPETVRRLDLNYKIDVSSPAQSTKTSVVELPLGEALEIATGMPELHQVCIDGHRAVTGSDLQSLEKLPNLASIIFDECVVDDAALECLGRLRNLEMVQFVWCRLPDASLKHLHGLQNLETLSLFSEGISPATVAALQGALPNCVVETWQSSHLLPVE